MLLHGRDSAGIELTNDRLLINSKIDKLFNLVEGMGLAEVIDTEMEILNI